MRKLLSITLVSAVLFACGPKKLETKEVKSFGDDDDFTTPTKTSSDFSLD